MANTFVMVSSGEASSVEGPIAIRAQTSTVNLLDSTPLPSGSPISTIIKKWPRLASGQIRVRVGAGGGTFTLTLTASDIILGSLPRPVPLAITGPADYFWPSGGRKSLATALTRVVGPIPGGTVAVDLIKVEGKIAGDGATGVLGLLKPGAGIVAPGAMLQVVTSGPALASCSGGWGKGDVLVCAAKGTLRKLAMGEKMLDHVAVADADQADGDADCPVTVGLVAV